MADITPTQDKISSMSIKNYVTAWNLVDDSGYLNLYKPLMLSLPNNDDLKSLLTSLCTRLTNRYLVTRVIQCGDDPMTYLCDIAKPFIWHRSESASSASERWSGDEFRVETEGDQSDEG